MQAGRLRHRITIERDAGTADAAGQVIASWQTWLANEPAEVIETGGAEKLRGFTIDATASHVVRLRYRDGLHERLRCRWGARILGIVNARDIDGRGREAWLMCEELK
jgi:head-tail adaptor